MKHLFIFLLIFQFNSLFGQKTLEQVMDEIPLMDYDYVYKFTSDETIKLEGISVQDEPQILARLGLDPLEYGEYSIVGKYEINHSIVLFLSTFSETEELHFAILLDKSLNRVDRLDETAYDNAEGFYSVRTWIDLNILTKSIHNIYSTPEYISKKYSITDAGFEEIKDQLIVTAPSGIRIRQEPTIYSDVIGSARAFDTLDYLSREWEIDSTSVIEDGKYLKDYWIEIAGSGYLQSGGYIFGAFVNREIRMITNDYRIVINEISKEDFDVEERKKSNEPIVEKITDIHKIRKLLKRQLVGEYNREYDYFLVRKIIPDNRKVSAFSYQDEYIVTAYFPTYHYLLLEGGHQTEYIIDLKTGEDNIGIIGNPDYYLSSPRNTFRLNGFYTGQANYYFLEQKKENAEPEYLCSFSSILALDYIETYFWKDDTTMFMKIENVYYSIEMQKQE